MSRWQPDSRGRLQLAAMELYVEHGFEQTTVADIAERAGLTERTFFRHFTDKREVLFFGQDKFQELFISSVALAPEGASPLATITAALHAAALDFEPRRRWSQERQRIINTSPGLQERELIKLAGLSAAVAASLRERGVGEPAASLTAQSCTTVFHVAFQQWIAADNTRTFTRIVGEALDALKAVTAG
ncbi:TetR family transcriptional regulator [Arthrobacter sp. ERGS1:01]|uniref:TetR/AcrR family transcriptional regulator n=1 Tax=Arthrobacter sp. ERGS1:01 TaxID=1704044 RepID=UPI0006B63E1A|nr:TetR/AcrR family transcriptional regulator [Arthrobacter sp. ERGS1:01]ALE06301.1 TetR family transcriptional regulator [Arthrobacter sp. ERGS1:01]